MKKYIDIIVKLWLTTTLDRTVEVMKQFVRNGWLPKNFVIKRNFAVVLDGEWCFLYWDGETLIAYPYDLPPYDDYVIDWRSELSNEANWLLDSIKLHLIKEDGCKTKKNKALNSLGAWCEILKYDECKDEKYLWKIETDMRLLRVWYKKHKESNDWFYEDMEFKFCFPGPLYRTEYELRWCDTCANYDHA